MAVGSKLRLQLAEQNRPDFREDCNTVQLCDWLGKPRAFPTLSEGKSQKEGDTA